MPEHSSGPGESLGHKYKSAQNFDYDALLDSRLDSGAALRAEGAHHVKGAPVGHPETIPPGSCLAETV